MKVEETVMHSILRGVTLFNLVPTLQLSEKHPSHCILQLQLSNLRVVFQHNQRQRKKQTIRHLVAYTQPMDQAGVKVFETKRPPT